MKQLVIMPGGFHPFHAGHRALYDAARAEFPDADVYVAATDDTSARPFPFAVKEKLARLAGVEPDRFVKVKSPFQAKEITAGYDPNDTVLIFVRSEKDRNKPPQAGGVKRDGSLAYLQPLGRDLRPMSQHGYMTYLPTVEFGPGLTSATEIRTAWPGLTDRRKTALVMSLYPRTQGNAKLANTVVKMLDHAIVGSVEENQGWAAAYNEQAGQMAGTPASGLMASYQRRENQPMAERSKGKQVNEILPAIAGALGRTLATRAIGSAAADAGEIAGVAVGNKIEDYLDDDYIEEKWSQKYKSSINCNNPKGFSQKAHCAGRKK